MLHKANMLEKDIDEVASGWVKLDVRSSARGLPHRYISKLQRL